MTSIYLIPTTRVFRGLLPALLLLLYIAPFRLYADNHYHMVPLALEERVKAADFVVEGEVVAQRSFWDNRKEQIYTAHTLQIYKVFKGEVRTKQLEVITEGGSVGLAIHVVSSALVLRKGQQGMFFLSKGVKAAITSSAATAQPYAGPQGFVRYETDRATAADPFERYDTIDELYRKVTTSTGSSYTSISDNQALEQGIKAQQQQNATQGTQAVSVTNISPTRLSAGTGSILTITGSGFGNSQGKGFVEFLNADDGGKTLVRPYITEYLSWTNTQIRVMVPSDTPSGGTAGTGPVKVTANDGTSGTSATTLTIDFAYSNVVALGGITPFQPLMIDANRKGGYTIQFAPSMQSRAAAQEGFRRAVNTWVCTTNVNWEIGTPSTNEETIDDTRSVISFKPASVTGQNILATTTSRYRGCIVELSGGRKDTVFWLTEFDMVISTDFNWQYGPGAPSSNQFDFETVMLHELGHAHQLSHVILRNALMHFDIGRAVQYRGLSAPDIAGANLVLNRSLNPPACGGRSPMREKLDGDCNLASEIFTFDAQFGTGGVVDVIWTTSSEQGIRHFLVQRSANGQDWEDIGQVEARGQPSDYSFTDSNPLSRRSFYRVRLVYTDGSSAFSGRVQVINPNDLRTFRVYPNPIGLATNPDGTPGEMLRIEYLVRSTTRLSLKLYDLQGRLVRDVEVGISDSMDVIELNMSDLASGTYVLRWSEGISSGVTKVVKVQ